MVGGRRTEPALSARSFAAIVARGSAGTIAIGDILWNVSCRRHPGTKSLCRATVLP